MLNHIDLSKVSNHGEAAPVKQLNKNETGVRHSAIIRAGPIELTFRGRLVNFYWCVVVQCCPSTSPPISWVFSARSPAPMVASRGFATALVGNLIMEAASVHAGRAPFVGYFLTLPRLLPRKEKRPLGRSIEPAK